MNRVAVALAVVAIRAYRVTISPLLGVRCRYTPTCSRYAEEALLRHGWTAGWRLAFGRFRRCNHRFAKAYDPVPDS